jgi:hypothetical protein
MGRKSKQRRLSEPGKPIAAWPGNDDFAGLQLEAVLVNVPEDGAYVDVVGESRCQSVLDAAAEGRTLDGPRQPDHIGVLLPEPSNVYDPNAVRVFLPAGRVGYLSREDAVRYRAVIDQLAASGQVLAARACITGGWDRGDGDVGSFGVVLYMGAPDSLALEIADSTEQPAVATQAAPAAWYADPTGRHAHRYWDGAAWTGHVANNGVAGWDPLSQQ